MSSRPRTCRVRAEGSMERQGIEATTDVERGRHICRPYRWLYGWRWSRGAAPGFIIGITTETQSSQRNTRRSFECGAAGQVDVPLQRSGGFPSAIRIFSLCSSPCPLCLCGSAGNSEPAGDGATRRPEADSKFEIFVWPFHRYAVVLGRFAFLSSRLIAIQNARRRGVSRSARLQAGCPWAHLPGFC